MLSAEGPRVGRQKAKLYITKNQEPLGATIEGIDLKVPDDELVKILKDALDNNLVIKIKNQKLIDLDWQN